MVSRECHLTGSACHIWRHFLVLPLAFVSLCHCSARFLALNVSIYPYNGCGFNIIFTVHNIETQITGCTELFYFIFINNIKICLIFDRIFDRLRMLANGLT